MKKFNYKLFLKYLFCALSFCLLNNLNPKVPFSISLLPAFIANGFNPLWVAVIFTVTNLFSFSLVNSALLCFSAIFLCVVFYLYRLKKATVKGELLIYLAIALLPYFLSSFTGGIYLKLIYSAIIYTFTLIFTLAVKVVFIKSFKRKNETREQIAFYLFVIIFSLAGIELFGVKIYELLALTTMLFLCKFYKSPKAFIPAFILPVAISLCSQSLIPLAIFEIYCASVILFLNLSPLFSALTLVCAQVAVHYFSGELLAFTPYDYFLTFLPSTIYLFTPQKIVDKLKEYLLRFEEPELTREIINLERSLLCLKLNELSNLFYDMEYSLNSFDEFFLSKEDLCEKLTDEVIQTVCATCPFHADCIRKKHPKREDLIKLINLGISKEKVSLIDLSRDFSSYCYSVNNMLYEINRLIEIYSEHDKITTQTKKYKKIISTQAGAVGEVLKNLSFDLSSRIDFKFAKEQKIFDRLSQSGIIAKQIYCLGEEYHLLFEKGNLPFSEISAILSEISGCEIRLKSNCDLKYGQILVFIKAPLLDASFGVAQLPKEGCSVCGDSHSLTKIDEGRFIVSLCDGMGSGGKAHKNSNTAISLFETLYKSGLSKDCSLELANRMLCVCSEDSFSSLDCAIVDLYDGRCDLIKIGATHGFLVGEKGVRIIENNSLPLGILEEITPDITTLNLEDGDCLIMLSDGISDAFFSSSDTVDFLNRENSRNPQTLANKLLYYAIDKYDGKAKDDMTAIVIRVYKRQNHFANENKK